MLSIYFLHSCFSRCRPNRVSRMHWKWRSCLHCESGVADMCHGSKFTWYDSLCLSGWRISEWVWRYSGSLYSRMLWLRRQKSSVFCPWWGFESTENVDLEEVWDWVLYSSWQLQHSQYNDVTKAYQCVLHRWYWIQNICVKVTKFNYVCKREAIRSIQCLMPKAWFSVRHMHKHNWAQGHHSEDAHHTSISTSTNGTNVFVLSCAYPYVKWERFAVSTSINRDNCFPIKVW